MWECQRAFILLLLKHEVCHHCSDLFPSERIVPADLDKHRKSVLPIQNHFAGIRYETFTQARSTEFKLESAGYVARDTWFVNETERFLLTLSTLPGFAEYT